MMFECSMMKKILFYDEYIGFKYIDKKHSFDKHIHDNHYMIGSFVEGRSVFNIDAKTYDVQGDILCLIPPKVVHSCKSYNINEKWQFLNFFPSLELLNKLASSLYDQELSISFNNYFIEDKQLAKILKYIISKSLSEEKLAEDELLDFLILLIEKYAVFNEKLEENPKVEKFEKLFLYLKTETYDLKELDFFKMAEIMEMNPYYFHRIFSKTIGLTPQNFINALRVSKATKMIQKHDSLASIAQESGFYDQAYFSKQFKRYHGVTPKNFKKIC